MSMAPAFIRSLALVRRFVAVFGRGSDPVGKFSFLNRNRAESIFSARQSKEKGMDRNKPAGRQDQSVRKSHERDGVVCFRPSDEIRVAECDVRLHRTWSRWDPE